MNRIGIIGAIRRLSKKATPKTDGSLHERKKALEEQFARKRDQKLLEKLRMKLEKMKQSSSGKEWFLVIYLRT